MLFISYDYDRMCVIAPFERTTKMANSVRLARINASISILILTRRNNNNNTDHNNKHKRALNIYCFVIVTANFVITLNEPMSI